MNNTAILRRIQQLISQSPLRLIEQICSQLDSADDWLQARVKVASLLPSSDMAEDIMDVFLLAQSLNQRPTQLAFALRSAAAVEEYHRNIEQAELVWTGPTPSRLALRRIDEALLQIIASARSTLTLISFAVYPVARLSLALGEAIQKGISVRFFLEFDTQKVAKPTFASIKGQDAIQIYTWADQYRSRTAKNNYGTLHAKAAVADGQYLLISSANLTEQAMSLNMELGVMISGGPLPRKLDMLLDDFIAQQVLTEIRD